MWRDRETERDRTLHIYIDDAPTSVRSYPYLRLSISLIAWNFTWSFSLPPQKSARKACVGREARIPEHNLRELH